MTVLADVFDSLGVLGVSTDARNVLIWPLPDPPGTPPRLVEGMLAHPSGDLSQDGALRPRLSAFLGQGSNLTGVAAELATLLAQITNRTTTAPVPTRRDVGLALTTYSATHLGATWTDRLLVGLRLPLPIEIDAATGDWVTNLETVRAWRDAALLDRRGSLYDTAAALPIEDPDTLRTDVATDLAAAGGLDALATPLAVRLLTNPFEVVFRVVEVFRQVRARVAADEPRLAVAMLAGLVRHQVDLLAWTSAGHAVLRRLWWALSGPAAAGLPLAEQAGLARARRMVADGLGLRLRPGAVDDWHHPDEVGPTVLPHELTLPASASAHPTRDALELAKAAPAESRDGAHVMVLGRDVCAGSMNRYRSYRGPAHGGRVDVTAFIATHRAEIGATPASPRIQARVEIVAAIAPNEGWVDAARLRDMGMVSTGMQQWTVHGNDEMTVLLEHFRGLAPDQFDLYFGRHQLGLRIWTRKELPAAAAPPGAADVTLANPEADPAVVADPRRLPADPAAHFPRFVTLFRILAGGVPERMPRGTGDPRFSFFGGTKDPTRIVFAPRWAALVRIASLCSIEYRVAQVQTAAHRFDRIVRGAGTHAVPGIPGVKWPVTALFTSQYGAALLLDAHINAPGNVPNDIATAIDNTPGAALVGGSLASAWLVTLAERYQVARHLESKVSRDKFINGLRNGGTLSAAAGSFTGW